jgi:hypothetical protein
MLKIIKKRNGSFKNKLTLKKQVMKKLAILSGTFLLIVAVAQGQVQKTEKEKGTKKEVKTERKVLKKLEGTDVSVLAKNNFSKDFSDVKIVQSKRVNTFDEFLFTDKNGQEMKAYYDYEGTLVGTTQNKTFADIPDKAQKEIKAKYKEYKIGDVTFFDDNEYNDTDMMLWGLQFDDKDLYFVELTKGTSNIIVQVDTEGRVTLFKKLS